MPVTPNHNLYYPGGGDQIAPLHPILASMQDSVEDALDGMVFSVNGQTGDVVVPPPDLNNVTSLKVTNIPASADLNTYTTQGTFHQGSNANAAGGSNYPEPYAGLLEVLGTSAFVYQRYWVYRGGGVPLTGSGKVWVRSWNAGVWGAWSRVDSISGTWQALPLASGFSSQSGGTARYRLGAGGGGVEFSWGVSNAGMSAGDTFRIVEVGGLAESCRPGTTKYFPISGSAANNMGMALVYASGALDIRCGSNLSSYYILDAIRFAPGS